MRSFDFDAASVGDAVREKDGKIYETCNLMIGCRLMMKSCKLII